MLPKENRLKRKKDFDNVITRGQQVSGSFLVLKFYANKLNITRVGFVVSKRISKKAVFRNKIKRRLREAVKQELFNTKPGFDLIFFARREVKEKEFSDIQQSIKRIIDKAQLYA